MRHRVATDEIRQLAAAYSLGALEPEEEREFEVHLGRHCHICRAELEGFESTVSALGLSAVEQSPPAEARWKLLSMLKVDQKESAGDSNSASMPQFLSIRGDEGAWQELYDGVTIKRLYMDDATGLATSVVRMRAGTSLPRHRHRGAEQVFVLEGDCRVHGQQLGPGDYHRAEAGSIHESTSTVDGTVFLLVAPDGYEVLEAR